MRRSSSLLGLIGLVLLLFAIVAAIFTRGQTPVDKVYIGINAGFGLFALVAYLSTGIESIREVVGQRSTKYGANVVVGSVVFVAILGLLNFISYRNHRRFDLTEQGVYSLSEQSQQVVKKLAKDLNVKAFVEGGINPALHDLLETYGYHSDKFHFDLVDPDREPQLAEEYKIRAYNSIRFEYGSESAVITEPTEENITNAIIKVTRDTQKTACFVEGHGEVALDDSSAKGLSGLKTAFEAENYKVEKTLLATLESVPAQCSMIVIAGPDRPFQPNELTAIKKYLTGGGRAMFMVRPRTGEDLKPLLVEYGVTLEDTVVVDQVVRLFQGPSLGLSPLVREYGAHEITANFRQVTMFPMVRSVRATSNGRQGLEVAEIAKTSESSWGETDIESIFSKSQAALDEGVDKKGPVPVAVAVTANADAGENNKAVTRIVVFGSSDFAQNRDVEGTYYNKDLILNAAGWLAGQSDLMSIRPRDVRASRAQFSPEQGTVIFYLSVLLIPQLLLLTGIAVWWRRE